MTHLQQQRNRNNNGDVAAIISGTAKKNKAKSSSSSRKSTKHAVKDAPCNHRFAADDDDGSFVIGFFHPYCTAGGGGERVLWKFIQALGELKEEEREGRRKQTESMVTSTMQHRRSKTKKSNTATLHSTSNSGNNDEDDVIIRRNCRNLSVVVYTVDEPTDNYYQDVMEKVRERFSIIIPSSLHIQFVHLHEVKYLLGKLLAIIEQFFVAEMELSCLLTSTFHHLVIL